MRAASGFALACVGLLSGAQAMKEEDRINGRQLPGWKCMRQVPPFGRAAGENCLPSRHYSGYIDISEERDESKMLHYWFVEAEQVNPSEAPVTLWLNGGPGCSSMDGFFYEMGPLHVNDRDFTKLDHNPHAWTTISNMIYLEAPVGVGFSYHTLGENMTSINDNSTAAMNYMGLKRFFEAFDEYKHNDLYLSGESYAGIYIPTLAEQILQGRDNRDADLWSKPWANEPEPLQGILVGNGCNGEETWSCGEPPAEVIDAYANKMRTSPFDASPAASRVNFLHDHAIISHATYTNIMTSCAHAPSDFNTRTECSERRYGEVAEDDRACGYERNGEFRLRGPYNDTGCCDSESRWTRRYCDGCGGTPYYQCGLTVGHAMYDCCEAMNGYDDDIGNLDIYGIYEYCSAGPEDNARRQGRQGNLTWSEEAEESLYQSSRFDREETVENELYGLGGCWGGTESATEYLNRDDVRATIHVMSRQNMTELYGDDGADWTICASRSNHFNYDRGYTKSLMPRYPYLVANIRVLIFSGDVDACVPYTGTQRWTEELAQDNNWPVDPELTWQAWSVQDQVGGYVTVYDASQGGPAHDFTFATVFGAGHMVPQTQPRKALALFDRFINNKGWERPQRNPVRITRAPVPTTVLKGASITLTVQVEGGSIPYIYQWFKDGALLPGETMHEMSILNSEPCHVGEYHVRVEEMDGTYALSARVQVAVATTADGCLTAECTADQIKSLPGWNRPFPSKQYSGYIDVTPDCVHDRASASVSCADMPTPFTGKRMLHYWFVEAEQVDPSHAPVVLWLNGGPGCSSMGGLFTEMGPWRVNEEDPKEVGHNAYTWCGPANMIYLESPIGVGFSYTTESDFGRNVKVNDNSTAEMNYLFLKRFYQQYPQFASNELFLTGESYAGIYVPTLAEQIMRGQDRGETLTNNEPMNLQGIMVGNGCTGTDTVSCGERPDITDFLLSAAGIELTFAHQHALISDDTYEHVLDNCDSPLDWKDCFDKVTEPDPFSPEKCRGPRVINGTCFWYCPKHRTDSNFDCCEATRAYEDDMGTLNIYGIYDTCKDDPEVNATAETERVQRMCGSGVGGRRLQETQEADHEDSACADSDLHHEARITGPQHMYDTVKLLKPHREAAWMHQMGLANSDYMYAHGLSGCWGGSNGLTQWLNRDDVRAAIHVKSQSEMKDMYGDSPRSYLWRDCGMKNVDYERGATSTLLPRFPALIERYHVLIFSGDVDACVPYIGTQSWTRDVAAANHYTPVDEWAPWTVDGQVGGYVSSWRTADEKEFTFATVYHAGHMVPKDEPIKALALFDRFIGQKGWNPAVSPILVSSQSPTGGPLEVEHNSRVSFSVAVHGGAKPYIYQWLKDGVPIFGATLPRYSIDSVDDCHIGGYRCEVYSTEGVNTISDTVELTVGGAIATAQFRTDGVNGRIVIEQPKAGDPSTVALEFRGLTECTSGSGCAFHVHESAVVTSAPDVCTSTGGHYSPTGFGSDVWALSDKLGTLRTARVEQVGMNIDDLPLFGSDTVVGRSIVVHKPNGDRWLCATIEPGGRTPRGKPDRSNESTNSNAVAPGDDSIGSAAAELEADAESGHSGIGTFAAVFVVGLSVGIIATKLISGEKKAVKNDGIEMSMYASGANSDTTL